MRTVINPPALSTLLSGWLRGGLSVELSVGLSWLIALPLLGQGLNEPLMPTLILFAVLWTALVVLACFLEHTVTIANNELEVRTWSGVLLGRPGRRFPIQQPRLASGRITRGGGLPISRMWLVDGSGRAHKVSFALLGFGGLRSQVAQSPLGQSGIQQL